MSELDQIREELREIKELLLRPAERPDDLVSAAYIAARLDVKERTVKAGKAGTNAIPRVALKAEGSKRALVRFPRAAVDKFIADLNQRATSPKQRAAEVMASIIDFRRSRTRRAQWREKKAGGKKTISPAGPVF